MRADSPEQIALLVAGCVLPVAAGCACRYSYLNRTWGTDIGAAPSARYKDAARWAVATALGSAGLACLATWLPGSREQGAAALLIVWALFLFLCCQAIFTGMANYVEDISGTAQAAAAAGDEVRTIHGSTVTEITCAVSFFQVFPCAACTFLGGLIAWALAVAGTLGAAPFIVLGSFAGVGACLFCCCGAVSLQLLELDGIDLAEGFESAAESIDEMIQKKLQTGTIRLLSCRWLLRTCGEPGAVLSRRQDLPDEAFLSPAEAVKVFLAGRVFVLSYGWQTPLHPDPLGFVLRLVVQFLASAWAARFHPEAFGLFWDFASVPQKSPAGEERSEIDQAVFKEALGAMSFLYGSLWRSAVIQVTQLPQAAPAGIELNIRPYHDRGWCVMEEAAAQLATHHRGPSGDGVPKLIDISVDVPVVYEAVRKPTIGRIEDKIDSATFTGKGDKDIVMKQIREFNTKLSAGKRLSTLKPSEVPNTASDAFCTEP